MRPIKSTNPTAGKYFYRGVYIMKASFGRSWYARCAEMGVDIPNGLSAPTLNALCFKIDWALKKGKS